MKKIGLYYSFKTEKTSKCAKKVQEAFETDGYEMIPVDVNETLTDEELLQYDYMILGAPTWFDGELPYYWDELVPAIEDFDMKGKTVAIFGLGNQDAGTENFVDAIGLLGKLMEERGARLIGFTDPIGYDFERSEALREGKFMGLALDIENQAALTNERIEKWVTQLKEEM